MFSVFVSTHNVKENIGNRPQSMLQSLCYNIEKDLLNALSSCGYPFVCEQMSIGGGQDLIFVKGQSQRLYGAYYNVVQTTSCERVALAAFGMGAFVAPLNLLYTFVIAAYLFHCDLFSPSIVIRKKFREESNNRQTFVFLFLLIGEYLIFRTRLFLRFCSTNHISVIVSAYRQEICVTSCCYFNRTVMSKLRYNELSSGAIRRRILNKEIVGNF